MVGTSFSSQEFFESRFFPVENIFSKEENIFMELKIL